MKTYLAITIGPIHRTIQRAEKTRELWAASFLLSQFMRQLLCRLKTYGTALSPDISQLDELACSAKGSGKKHHGAGIWNDNCFFEIHHGQAENLKAALPKIIADAKKEIISLALHEFELDKKDDRLPLDETRLRQILAQHFHCHAALLVRDPAIKTPILKQLGQLTASAEMLDLFPARDDDFVSRAMFRGRAVRNLYNEGFDDFKKVFTFYGTNFHEKRLPSLLEIAVREFRGQKKKLKFDEETIEDIISKRVKKMTAKGSDDDLETDEENLAILNLLKTQKDEQGNPLFKKRHKYVAIVQSDGDGVGKLITEEKDDGKIREISKALMNFSIGAVEKIVAYEGLPVYAGGDDLLFIAPLRNQFEKNIFDLLADIQAVFHQPDEAGKTLLKDAKASLSFGLSIFYYKYPVGEAHENARELLNRLAKKLSFRAKTKEGEQTPEAQNKNALAFRVMLHGGQSFAATLRQEGTTWELWKELVKKPGGTDLAFVAGVVHNLERLAWLLDDACANGSAEAFFDHHFNEAKGTERWKFIETVRELAEAIHDEYAELFPPNADPGKDIKPAARKNFFRGQLDLKEELKKFDFSDTKTLRTKFCNNLLYSALRMIQFLNADDHE